MSIYFYFYQDELLYIGSTFNMKERIRTHKKDYENDVLLFHRDLKANGLAIDDLQLEEVKTGITDDQKLRDLEGKCIKMYKPTCNVSIPGRTQKEYREDNKEELNVYIKSYYKENSTKIMEQHKIYNLEHRDNLKQYKKKYRDNNKEKIKEAKKKYKKDNRDEINRKTRERYNNNKEEFNRKQREYRAKKRLEKLAAIQEQN